MKKRVKHFSTEVDLCAVFLNLVPDTWTAYAETGGWDILLARKVDGFQVGIQAKLHMNAHVVSQALEYSYHQTIGPDCRAVLVPEFAAVGWHTITAYLGLVILTVGAQHGRNPEKPPIFSMRPELPKLSGYSYESERWQEWAPAHRVKLPEYVPDVAAGASAPLQLTTWKIAALKIAVILEHRGFVTREDFKHLGIDHRRWTPSGAGWLAVNPTGPGYVSCATTPDFRRQHPTVFEQVAADAAKWMPKTTGKLV